MGPIMINPKVKGFIKCKKNKNSMIPKKYSSIRRGNKKVDVSPKKKKKKKKNTGKKKRGHKSCR
jgi:hypothetical protein